MLDKGTMKRRNKKSGALAKAPFTFLLVMGVLLIALGWLGWLLLDQDRSLQHERTQNRVDSAAEELAAALRSLVDEELAELETLLQSMEPVAASQYAGLMQSRNKPGITVYFSGDSLHSEPVDGLRYVPVAHSKSTTHETLARADRLEFQQGNLSEAVRLLESLIESASQPVRAEAHLRLGRIHNRRGDFNRSLDEYARLAEFENEYLDHVPAPWLARYARCKIFLAQHDEAAFTAELQALSALIVQGGRFVTKPTYRFYAEAVNTWVRDAAERAGLQLIPLSHAFSDAVADLHNLWNEQKQGRGNIRGVRLDEYGQSSLFLSWSSRDSALLGRVMELADLNERGLMKTTAALEAGGLGWSIADNRGVQLLGGLDNPLAAAATLNLAIGDSPLAVKVFETAAMQPMSEDVQRRRLLLAGLAMVLIVILASTYFILRALKREAETAELQSGFVAAVSHEFRTPLTSIRQLLELLASGRIRDQEKVAAYYRILDKESARLQRMVEDLLDFQRLEANARIFRPERLDVAGLLSEICESFREEYQLKKPALELEAEGNLFVHIDRESLTRSVWNLLDNAVKYSEDEPRIRVVAKLEGEKVAISVSDCGIGISQEEQATIFNKFVRGHAAKISNARGTGLGLAMVRTSLEGQGGSIRLQSLPGKGSTFTILLTAENPA